MDESHAAGVARSGVVKPIIEFNAISQLFPGVKALDDVSFTIAPGEIHAVVGENGAGKSTLMKILAGEYPPSGGEIRLCGKVFRAENQQRALELGIGIVYQELRLCPNLTVVENIFLGHELRTPRRRLNWPEMSARARSLLDSLGSALPVSRKVKALSIAEQQIVEIAKVIAKRAEVLILDEPTSALALTETENLLGTIRGLNREGVTILYISHRMEEIFAISDRISVLRDGRYLGTLRTVDSQPERVVEMIAGEKLTKTLQREPAARRELGEPILEVEHLARSGSFADVSFTLHRGEILGVYGLQGAGRTELLETLFGIAPRAAGTVRLFGREVHPDSPRAAIDLGMAMVPEDRRRAGIFPNLNIEENINTSNPKAVTTGGGLLKRGAVRSIAEQLITRIGIKPPRPLQNITRLSGGNQQKVIIARWLATNPKLLLVDELTRGVDVGAKAEIYTVLRTLRARGLAIILVSSEVEQVLSESDRILIMNDGALTATLTGPELTKENIITYALQGGRTK